MKFGAIFSKSDVRDYKMKLVAGDINLPKEYECPNMPAVKDQKDVCSCVAHALAVIVEWHSRRQGDSKEDMSTAFIYGNRLNTTWTGAGMITRDAVDAVKKCGTCEKKLMPKNIEIPEAIEYFKKNYSDCSEEAYKNRWTAYARIEDFPTMKVALIKYGPMAIAMDWYSDITFSGEKMIMNTEQDKKKISGGHCMIIYGYNDIGWLVQNSWGPDWGSNGGRCIIPYNIHIREVYQIIDDYSEAQQKAKIVELEKSNAEMREKIIKLSDEILKLQSSLENLEKYKELTEEQKKQMNELTKLLSDSETQIAALLAKMAEQEKEITILKQQLIEVKKPFKSKIGQLIAKIINAIINAFGRIFKR